MYLGDSYVNMYEMAKLFFGSKGSSNLDRSILIFSISFDLLINTAPRFEFDDSPIHAHLGQCKCSLFPPNTEETKNRCLLQQPMCRFVIVL